MFDFDPSHKNDDRLYVLEEDGPHPCPDQPTWDRWVREQERRLAHVTVGDYEIVTEFTGFDSREDLAQGEPLLFRTTITPALNGLETRDYDNCADAMTGHVAALDLARDEDPTAKVVRHPLRSNATSTEEIDK